MNRTGVVVLVFVGVFLAGAVSGGFVGARLAESWAHRSAAGMFAQKQFWRVADQLSLASDQRERIGVIITKAAEDVQVHRREISSIAEKMEAAVRHELTEEQRSQFDVVRGRMRENERHFQKWVREQRAHRLEGKSPPNPAFPPPAP